MNGQPGTIANELINSLSALKPSDVDSLTIRRLEKEASALMNSSPAMAHMVLGAIATFKKNLEKVHYHHNIAIRLDPFDVQQYFNYEASLNRMFLFDEAAEQLIKAYDFAKENLTVIDRIITALLRASRFNEAKEFIEVYNNLSPKKENENYEVVKMICSFLDHHKIPLDAPHQLAKIGASVAIGHNVLALAHDHEVDAEFLIIYLQLATSFENMEDLQDELDARIEESDLSSNVTDHIFVQYVTDDPNFEKFLDFMDEADEKESGIIVEADKKQLDRISKLVEGVELK